MKTAKQLHRNKERIAANHAGLLPPQANTFLLEVFKYVANMLMLMNGVAAMTLLNKDPIIYKFAIAFLAGGCLVAVVFYVFAYFAYCDMCFPNPRWTGNMKRLRYKYFAWANYCILVAFVASAIAFYCGIVLFLPGVTP